MDAKHARVGAEVTWGTGDIRGSITLPPFDSQDPESGEVVPFIRCSLTQPYTTPCGRSIPKGTVVTVPLSIARSLS